MSAAVGRTGRKMPYLNVDIDYFSHPETKRLIRLLGKGSEILPLRLWAYTAHYFVNDGRLTGISTQEIEAECSWWGASGEMVRVMLMPEIAVLLNDNGTLVVHNWLKHQGHLATFAARARTAANARWGRDATSNAPSITTSNAPTNLTNQPNQPNQPNQHSPPAADERLYAAYPRRVGKQRAMKAIAKAVKIVQSRPERQEDARDWLLARVKAFAASPAGNAGKYTPHPATWFNDGRFDDDDAEWQRTERTSGKRTPEARGEFAEPELHW